MDTSMGSAERAALDHAIGDRIARLTEAIEDAWFRATADEEPEAWAEWERLKAERAALTNAQWMVAAMFPAVAA